MKNYCFFVLTMVVIGYSVEIQFNDKVTIKCPDDYELRILQRNSMEHAGHGSFVISVCCPTSHREPVFFGRDGVGCCQTRGKRCFGSCKCKDYTDPRHSLSPILKTSGMFRRNQQN